jgi:hypothetical protein
MSPTEPPPDDDFGYEGQDELYDIPTEDTPEVKTPPPPVVKKVPVTVGSCVGFGVISECLPSNSLFFQPSLVQDNSNQIEFLQASLI